MARGAKRKKSVGNASSMAAMRDASMMREYHFVTRTREMEAEGPGSDSPPKIHQLNMDASETNILSEFMGIFIDVMYIDLIAPGSGTPRRMEYWHEIAKEVVVQNKDRAGVRKTFINISARLRRCSKYLSEMIHFEATSMDMKIALYDMILKISMEFNVNLKGVLPTM